MSTHRFGDYAVHACLAECCAPNQARAVEAELLRRRTLREVYDATPPRDGLCDFDAQGMDIIEGRRI
ncbi:hypothetical protein ACQR1Y_12010 [Bradyrhizobium sp. HKCCYLRH3099]|uniref:hypothetical protein n=1 Tax=unclassified Bradyrhizobium TaxID=2631580 RepID=UPI003EC14639